MMTRKQPEIIEMDFAKLDSLLDRAEQGTLAKEDHQTIRAVFESYAFLTQLIDQKSTTIRRLRTLLFGASTEKTAALMGRESSSAETDSDSQPRDDNQQDSTDRSTSSRQNRPRKKGHGRNGEKITRAPIEYLSLTRRSRQATLVPSAREEPCIKFHSQESCCGLLVNRQCKRRFTSYKNCAAVCVARYSRQRRPRISAPINMTPRSPA